MNFTNIAPHLNLDINFVIRNAARPEGFHRDVWQAEVDALVQRGSVQITRVTDTHVFLRFI